ncbi:alpha/beta fold hydrolase [Aestuariibacter salexigens]|uniref:alpha/beta fold hydrolase n=1 Tax=Aestuariibacter salexigens TaxID=226010 RepID=UPI000413CF7E|nr:alpha/beta hydrolase [Aestuariibacter salexigens]
MVKALACLFACVSLACAAHPTATSSIYEVNGQQLHVASWMDGDSQSSLPWLVLLSGPVDTWHSDTAWYAALAPRLAQHFRVIAVDRSGLINAVPDAQVGYARFAEDLAGLFTQLNISNATVVAFASSNISMQIMLNHPQSHSRINQVVLIDPDVLSPFSIARYKSDAAPFKENLTAYLEYIGEGKYTSRVEQKNAADRQLVEGLLGNDQIFDIAYFDKLLSARRKVVNQQNLFKEIARYGDDLNAAAQLKWPANVPVTVIDTDFEQGYINASNDPETTAGLQAWKEDGEQYYRQLAAMHPQSQYVRTDSTAHLYQVVFASELADMLIKMRPVSN